MRDPKSRALPLGHAPPTNGVSVTVRPVRLASRAWERGAGYWPEKNCQEKSRGNVAGPSGRVNAPKGPERREFRPPRGRSGGFEAALLLRVHRAVGLPHQGFEIAGAVAFPAG